MLHEPTAGLSAASDAPELLGANRQSTWAMSSVVDTVVTTSPVVASTTTTASIAELSSDGITARTRSPYHHRPAAGTPRSMVHSKSPVVVSHALVAAG